MTTYAGPSLPPSYGSGGGGFDWGNFLSNLGPYIGAGVDIWQGMNQDQQAAANFAQQQQRMQMMMGLLGPMFQGSASPQETMLNQMLGIQPQGATPNPWGNYGTPGGSGAPARPGGSLPNKPASNPSGDGPWWNPYGTGTRGIDPRIAGSFNMMVDGGVLSSPTPGGMPGGLGSEGMVPFTGQGSTLNTNQIEGWGRTPFGGGGFTPGRTNQNGLGYTSGQYTPERIDVNSLMQNSGSMRGQDALFQMLNRDPAGQMVNAQNLIDANTGLFNRQTDRSADLLRGRARGLGQFAGTAAANAEALLRGDANAQLGAQNAGLLYNTATGNADRALNLYGQRIGGFGTLGQMGAQSGDQILRAMLANQQAGIGANQFNIANQNQANQFGIQTFLNSLMNAQGMGQQRNQYNLDLASIFGGLPIPQRNSQYNALGAASDAAWIPWMMGQMR